MTADKKPEPSAEEKSLDLEKKRVELAAARAELRKKVVEARTAEADWERKRLDDAAEAAANAFDRRRYYFNQEVDEDSVEEARDTVYAWTALDPAGPIVFEINSIGGSVFDGLDLFGVLRSASYGGALVTTRVTGLAASMAGVLAQAGDVREIRADSYLHLHEASSGAWGSASEVGDTARRLEVLTRKAVEIYAWRASMSADAILKQIDRRDWYLSADEALAVGFVDKIV